MSRTGTVVVTGAASGIGRAVVERFGSSGWTVAALDRDRDGLTRLGAAMNGRIDAHLIDVADPGQVAAAFSDVREAHGEISAVVAAAGIWTPGSVVDLDDDQWNRGIAINLTGMFNTARAGVGALRAAGGGSFVAIASDVGVQGSQGCAAYVAAKHGVVGLVRSMALDFGASGVRSNVVCPGFVDTAMTEQIFRSASPGLLQARRDEVPAGRFASPSEIAEVVVALIDPAFSFVNGATLLVDGGATAGYYTPREEL